MTRISENTPLVEVLLEASKTLFAEGERKNMHTIPGGYLMAVSKLELENSGGNFENFLTGSTYLTTQASFLPAYCGLPLSFGQALIEIPTFEPHKPALAIHKI